jgi:hypothetical protein
MKKVALLLVIGLAACEVGGTAPVDPNEPTDLSFQLMPSGDPEIPLGILLSWVPPTNGQASAFDVYGRSNSTGWVRRATTTSPTFHDAGVPQSQYYVIALDADGGEMGQSNIITVDMTTRLPAPANLRSTTLNGAIHLIWDDNAVNSIEAEFDHYRVYSATYDASRGICTANWYFEGSTVSDGFLVGNLQNGVSRCFAVSAISFDGHESTWSSARLDTPRSDATAAVVYAMESKSDSAGFVFNDETPHLLGVVAPATRTDADFSVSRHADGTLWISPARAGSVMRAYQTATMPSLSTIDRAPTSGYSSAPLQAVPGYGYVFQLQESDGTHYAAMRIQFVTQDFIVFDWAYQNGVGNPELLRRRRQ